MRILSRAFGRHAAGLPSWAQMDEEALRLASGLEHIDRHGNLDAFSETQSGKRALMAAALRSFDIELENPAAPPNKIASRQDSMPARSGAPARPDQVPAPVPPSSSTERPTAPPSTPHRAPAQVAPDSTAAESGSA